MEKREEARAFLRAYFNENKKGDAAFRARWAEVRRDLSQRNHYEHTPEELAYGARIAWRNHGKCIGRLFWESLEVFDCRQVAEPDAIADRVDVHLRNASADGRIRSIISVFAPVTGEQVPAWIESEQITQYACHQIPGGGWLGDRQNIEATQIAKSMGWQPEGEPGKFDLLPWFLRDRQGRRIRYDLRPGSVREVDIVHPDRPGFAELGLKWYAVPVVSGMILTIGGVDYPCAPFNGFYMGTEIASRNFADVQRYDLLADAAQALDIVHSRFNPLWIDETLTELNRAVLHSYQQAGVTILDHHTAARQYMEFHAREQRASRRVAGDWRWLVPPQAHSAHDMFHMRMRNFHPVPNYYRNRGEDGLRLMPWYGDEYRRRPQIWKDRLMRRWKIWKRMAW
ncbi:nitric oxide synthase oxygenase [Erythrobacter litoralis]|uniref:nitric oxide synthase oxygenase n=1 Tax=Erythrobacter litoralis TaxID=39960 RepID=UPI0024348D82|nr:nitric oxide synthase oxygenase [Erythrobacter litoralis]